MSASPPTPRDLQVVDVDSFTKPAWVQELLNGASTTGFESREGMTLEASEGEGLSYLQVLLPAAIDLEPKDLERRVTEVYGVIREELQRRRACHPIRFWNFVPGIRQSAHEGLARYEVFNAGRYAAFADWYDEAGLGRRMIASSGVGHRGPDLLVQVLAAEHPGRGLENPRQRSAYRYSRRYGPLPPCFARATVFEGNGGPCRGMVIVAGTASVVGEDSRHYGDVERQLAETCTNLESLIERADPGNGHRRPAPLSRFRELRAYVVDDAGRDALVDLLAASFPRLERLEIMPADLCRDELLIEVEGVISLDR